MGKTAVFIASALILDMILVSIMFSMAADGEHLTLLSLDFEIENGGLIVGGEGGPWEWGRPGPGSIGNPGPGEAGSGSRSWGCPLNGTYSEGSDSYLVLPTMDVSSQLSLELSFLYWSDLTYLEDERNGTGEILGIDSCLLEVSTDGSSWSEIITYSDSSGSSWQEESVDLSEYLGGDLHVRFRLLDEVDGFTDNGFFLDLIVLGGEEAPEVDMHLGDGSHIPGVVAVGESARIVIPVESRGTTIPQDSFITVFIETSAQEEEFFYQYSITQGDLGPGYVEWYPSEKGSFRGWINLTVAGEYHEGRSFNIRSYIPIYIDDSSGGVSHYDQDTIEGTTTWTTIQPQEDGFSMSSGKVIWFGSATGGPNSTAGFTGPVQSYIETGWIDLTYYTDSFLYIYHKYGFQGPMGSSGGIIEAYRSEGGWTVLEPVNLAYRTLKNTVPGPYSGSDAIVGSDEWSVQSFKLAPFIGSKTRIRFTVVSDGEGWGSGWFIDDIMVTGEGYDPFDTDPPAAVEGLDVEVVDDGAVTISYYPSNAQDFGSYRIYLEEFSFTEIEGLIPYMELDSADQDSVIVTDLDSEKEYWVAVTAVDVVGNEIDEVVPVSFIPTTDEQNQPPLADIKIIGGSYSRLVGEEITFDGSLSRDPEGDPLTYIWEMPDGSIFRGSTVKWTGNEAGEDLEVVLTVKDSSGLEGTDTVTIDILEDDDSIYQRGELTPFLLLVLPIVFIIVVLIFIVSIFRKSSRKKLERRLQRVGIDLGAFEGGGQRVQAHEPQMPSSASRSPKVHDLVPTRSVREKEAPNIPDKKKAKPLEPLEWKEHRVAKDLKPDSEEKGPEKVHYKPPPLIKVVIECPFCNEIFKERVDPNIINQGEVFTVKCPHCNRSGDITP